MITSYRISKTKHAANLFDGEGAFRFGGRWNTRGTRIIYTAGSLSLAILEMLVHLEDETLLSSYSYAAAQFDSELITAVEDFSRLPKNWNASPSPAAVQKIGDEWARSKNAAVLRVPTALVPGEFNYLIDPGHDDFKRITTGEPIRLEFDPRLTAFR